MDIGGHLPATREAGNGLFLQYVHLFRGVAILLIVAVHLNYDYLVDVVGSQSPIFHHAVTVNNILLHDSTIFFALISGILYVHVYARRGLFHFAKSRASNVALPYVLLSVLLTIVKWWKGTIVESWKGKPSAADIANWPKFLEQIGHDLFAGAKWPALLERIGHNLVTGQAWFHLWYVPIVFGMYVLSPFAYAVVRSRRFCWIAFILIALPLIVSRTADTVSLSSIGYFLGAYILGMFVGLDLDRWIDFIESKMGWFVVVAAAGTAALVVLYATRTSQFGFVSLDETAYYVQKTALAGILLVALRRWARTPGRIRDAVLGSLATWAFGIYFIHPLLMVPLMKALESLISPSLSLWLLGLDEIAAFAVLIALCGVSIKLAHGLVGRRSRYFIGA